MNVTNYTYLINKPDAITEKQVEALGNVLNEFPYFQSARALRLKGLYIQNSFKYNYALKVSAAHTTDRSVLFDFITSETFTSIQGEYYDRKLRELLNITVFDSEIILAEEMKKTAEIRVNTVEKSILDSIKEATTETFEEPIKIEKQPNHTVIEETKFTPTNETTLTETVAFIEPTPIVKLPTPTFFDEIVEEEEEELPEVKNAIVEQSIKKTSTVVFEKAVTIEESKQPEPQATIQITEENLEAEKTPDFTIDKKHSFQEWLQLSRMQPIDRTSKVPIENQPETIIEKIPESIVVKEIVEEKKMKKAEIIDKFIETNPKISPIKSGSPPVHIQTDIKREDNSYLMTETLARVYLEQKKYTKAIQAYEILILKYPEKITFFADRISEIKILQQNNNNNN